VAGADLVVARGPADEARAVEARGTRLAPSLRPLPEAAFLSPTPGCGLRRLRSDPSSSESSQIVNGPSFTSSNGHVRAETALRHGTPVLARISQKTSYNRSPTIGPARG